MNAKRLIPDGTPLVLLNAFPMDAAQWEPMLGRLGDYDGDIITFDPPGIGAMPATEEEPSLDLIADAAVAALREATGAARAIWVGCSMGGYVALAVLERHRDVVAGLGLLGSRATADTDEARANRIKAAEAALAAGGVPDPQSNAKGLLGPVSLANSTLVDAVVANIGRQGGAGIDWNQRAMAARPDRLSVLAAAQVPAIVARGGNDAITSAKDAQAMADALGVEVRSNPAAGHLLAWEDPEWTAGLIVELAARV